MTLRKTVDERWWNLYMNDNGCKEHFNGLHLLCAFYGNDEEDSDTLMQSMATNRNYQIETLEFATSEDNSERLVKLFYVERSVPRGVFAHLHSQLGSNLTTLKLERKKDKEGLQTWEDWGRMIFNYDDKTECIK